MSLWQRLISFEEKNLTDILSRSSYQGQSTEGKEKKGEDRNDEKKMKQIRIYKIQKLKTIKKNIFSSYQEVALVESVILNNKDLSTFLFAI